MLIDFDVNETIRKRCSVRTYDRKRTPDDGICRSVIDFALKTGNPFGVEGIRIGFVRKDGLSSGQKLGTYGVTRGAVAFLGLGVPDNLDAYAAAGYVFETAVLYATSLGLGTVWLGGTFTRSAFASAFGFNDELTLPAIAPIGYAAPRRMLERAMRSIAKSDSRKPWDRLFFDNRIGTPLPKTEAGPYADALSNVRLAPSSLNGQPWRILKIGDHFHFYADFNDALTGLDRKLKYIDMGIAICHFRITLEQAGIDGIIDKSDPGASAPADYHYIASWHRATTPDI